MPSNASIFFAGIGTTFLILGAGFGSGMMMANSALKEPNHSQSRTTAEAPTPLRVVLPSSAAAAEPKQPPQQAVPAIEAAAPAQIAPAKEAQALPDKVEKADTRKAEVEQRERRQRSAERKAKRLAARRSHQPPAQQRGEAPVMAFGGDESRQGGGFNLFGN